jgi:hypothetical protein
LIDSRKVLVPELDPLLALNLRSAIPRFD